MNTAQRHALVLGLDHHGDPARFQRLVDRRDDLAGQAFLGLEAAGEDVDDAGELREPNDFFTGIVGDMGLADERHHVVLAMRKEGDVTDEHDVVVAAEIFEGAIQRILGGLAVAGVEVLVGLCHPLRGIAQTLAIRIVTSPGDQRANGPLGLGTGRPHALVALGDRRRVRQLSNQRVHSQRLQNPVSRRIYSDPAGNCEARQGHTTPSEGKSVPRLGFLAALAFLQRSSPVAASFAPIYMWLMLDDIYNRRILEFAGSIPRIGRLDAPDATATAHSRLCGSTVTVDLKTDGDVVTDFAHDVKACALGQASSSIMAHHIVGARADELRAVREAMFRMLKEGGPPPEGRFADLKFLEPVRDYKARHASTMLTFDAVVDALDQIAAKRQAAPAGAA